LGRVHPLASGGPGGGGLLHRTGLDRCRADDLLRAQLHASGLRAPGMHSPELPPHRTSSGWSRWRAISRWRRSGLSVDAVISCTTGMPNSGAAFDAILAGSGHRVNRVAAAQPKPQRASGNVAPFRAGGVSLQTHSLWGKLAAARALRVRCLIFTPNEITKAKAM